MWASQEHASCENSGPQIHPKVHRSCRRFIATQKSKKKLQSTKSTSSTHFFNHPVTVISISRQSQTESKIFNKLLHSQWTCWRSVAPTALVSTLGKQSGSEAAALFKAYSNANQCAWFSQASATFCRTKIVAH